MFGAINPLGLAASLLGQEGAPALDISDRLGGQIEKAFTYHSPKPGQSEVYTAIRDTAKQLAKLMAHAAPEGRELQLALTKLEESVMWCNAAIARGGQ